MELNKESTINLNGQDFVVIKPTRLRDGMVLKSGDVFARLGPKLSTLDEQIHTVSLYNKGFPVPEVLNSGDYGDGYWYFTETSLGDTTFHTQFMTEYKELGYIKDETFSSYLKVIESYTNAQVMTENRTTVDINEAIETIIPNQHVLPNYCYFGFDESDYSNALTKVSTKLSEAPMGILQHDLNPFNVLNNGIIDFELVGSGPIAYDTLMSARWSRGWFTSYPSRYPVAYMFSDDQIARNDALIDSIAQKNGLVAPTTFMQEFLLLKSAWALSDYTTPQPDWPKDKLAFHQFRANVLNKVIKQYLTDQSIDYRDLCNVPGDELEL